MERRQPKNLAELERFMAEEWDDLPNTIVISLVRSMKKRCDLVIKNNGERISY